MRESILASIKLDDGDSNRSESDAANGELKAAIERDLFRLFIDVQTVFS